MFSQKSILQLVLVAAAGVASFMLALQWRRADALSAPALVEPVSNEHRGKPVDKASPVAEKKHVDYTLAAPDRTHAVPQPGGDAFSKLSWLPPPPVARAVVAAMPSAPALPVPPPLPFTFVGLIEAGAPKPQAFLAKGNDLLVVAAGDVIDANTYRIDSLNPKQIQLTYLPLNAPQTLNMMGTTQ